MYQHFVSFIEEQTDQQNDPILVNTSYKSSCLTASTQSISSNSSSSSHRHLRRWLLKCVFQGIIDCFIVSNFEIELNKLCHNCLLSNHDADKYYRCALKYCKMKHSSLLHNNFKPIQFSNAMANFNENGVSNHTLMLLVLSLLMVPFISMLR